MLTCHVPRLVDIEGEGAVPVVVHQVEVAGDERFPRLDDPVVQLLRPTRESVLHGFELGEDLLLLAWNTENTVC